MRSKLLALFLIFNMSLSQSFGASDLPIEIDADTIDYDRDNRMMKGVGNVVVNYQDTILIADKASINLNTKDVTAEGNVQLFKKDRQFSGKKLNYNFDTGAGEFFDAQGYFPPWYAGGDKIIRHSKDKYEIFNGYLTTCEIGESCGDDFPYILKAKKIFIYPGEKLVAYHVLITINHVPIFYLPIYVHYLKDIKSVFSFVPGHSREWGTFLLTKYTFFNNGSVRANAHVDYRSKRGLGLGLSGDYKFDPKGTAFGPARGSFKTYTINDQERELDDGSTIEDKRYRVSLSHRQSAMYNITMRAEVHKLSDEDILLDFFRKDFETSIRPISYVDFTKYNPKYTARLYYQPRLNDFFSEVEREPELKFDARRQQIFDSPFYFTSLSSLGNLSRTFANDETEPQSAVRFDIYNEVSYPKKYFGWVETNVWFGTRQTWYSRELDIDEGIFRASFSTGYEVGTKIYKVWDEIDIPKWNLYRLRHVIEPRLRHTFVDDPSVDRDRLIQFDSVDGLTGQNVIRPSLRNRLQTKRDNLSWDLIDLLMYIDYRLETDEGQDPFSNIFVDLELRPFRFLSIDFDWTLDYETFEVQSFNTDLAVFKDGKWRLSTGFRFIEDRSELFTYDLSYQLNEMWAFTVYNRWEFDTGDLEEQEYSLSHNFGCWTGTFSFRKVGEDSQFWFAFWVNAVPELEISVGN